MAIYLFVDESGDLNFSPSGSDYYCFGALSIEDPGSLIQAVASLRYELLEEGLELSRFHASEDRQMVRDRVFGTICSIGGFDFDSVVVEKRKAHPVFHEAARFYPKFCNYLLRYVLPRWRDRPERLVVFTDRLPLKRDRKAAEKTIKTAIRSQLGNREFTLLHSASAAEPCLQVADYCLWAVHRKWERRDFRSYELIRQFVRSEFDIFRSGRRRFY